MFKIIQKFTSILAWLQIAISPILIGIIIGLVLYSYLGGVIGLILSLIIVIAGFVSGIIWAEKTRKKKGTVEYLSRVMATPELDEKRQDS